MDKSNINKMVNEKLTQLNAYLEEQLASFESTLRKEYHQKCEFRQRTTMQVARQEHNQARTEVYAALEERDETS